MSHVSKIHLQVLNLDALIQAAKNLGLEFKENQKTYRWFSRFVGDYPLPAGYNVSDLGKCEHALAIKGQANAYEIGIVKSREHDGYELLYDFWKQDLDQYIGKNGCLLTAEYGAVCAEMEFADNGYDTTREIDEDGFIVVEGTKLVEY